MSEMKPNSYTLEIRLFLKMLSHMPVAEAFIDFPISHIMDLILKLL